MTVSLVIGAGVIVLVLSALVGFKLARRHPNKKLDVAHFTRRWKELQKNCVTRKTWPLAIIEADNLLDDALKKRHFKGKTTGERLVAAQHMLTSNDTVWFAHKLRNHITHEDVRKIKKQEVKDALTGFRQALKDLGALQP